jgi:hypothetical protein
MSHVPWADIGNFHTVRKSVVKVPELTRGRHFVRYRSKVKLHGTNAGVRVDAGGKVQAFSRTSLITPGCDNVGFASWVESNREKFSAMASPSGDFVVYGEWCGPGVKGGTAAASVDRKFFAVFAVRFLKGDADVYENEPLELEKYVDGIADAYVIPWYRDGESIYIDLCLSPEGLQPELDVINSWVADVERVDPWVKSQFGIEGIGEGLVFYPCRPHGTYGDFSNLAFKAKGEKHRVVDRNRPAQADPTTVENAQQFAELVLPEARLVQGAETVLGERMEFDFKMIGPFLAWVNKDVEKECQAELDASGLTWKVAGKAVSVRARDWFIKKIHST